MAKNRSLVCTGISGSWWWLLTLLGLGLIYALLFGSREAAIENELHQRIADSLNAEQIDWAKVSLAGRGRDALLAGTAPSESAKGRALDIARSVPGVRVVEERIEVAAELASPEVDIEAHDGKVVLRGSLSSREAVDDIVEAARAAYGADKVDNQLTVSDKVGGASWLSSVIGMMPGLSSLEGGHLHVSDSGSHLSGTVASEEGRSRMIEKARGLFGSGFESDMVVAGPPVEVAEPGPEKAAEAPAGQPTEVPAEQPAAGDNALTLQSCQEKIDALKQEGKILFEYNRAVVSRDSYALLDRIADVVKTCESVLKHARLAIVGHTDSRGSEAYNQALSQRRAEAVRKYLIGAGVDAALVYSAGKGESDPVASNDTEEGRAQNRRITFTLEQNNQAE